MESLFPLAFWAKCRLHCLCLTSPLLQFSSPISWELPGNVQSGFLWLELKLLPADNNNSGFWSFGLLFDEEEDATGQVSTQCSFQWQLSGHGLISSICLTVEWKLTFAADSNFLHQNLREEASYVPRLGIQTYRRMVSGPSFSLCISLPLMHWSAHFHNVLAWQCTI